MAKRDVFKYETETKEFTIIGISSHENDYRLTWSINQQLGLAFVQSENLLSDHGKEFTCFAHNDDDTCLMLVSNRCDNGFLLDKYRKIDFILKFDDLLNESEKNEWLNNLRKVPFVLATMHITVNKHIMQLLDL